MVTQHYANAGTGTFFVCPRSVLSHPELSATARCVLLLLVAHADNRTGEATISRAELGAYLGVNTRTITTATNQLLELGLIAKPDAHSAENLGHMLTYKVLPDDFKLDKATVKHEPVGDKIEKWKASKGIDTAKTDVTKKPNLDFIDLQNPVVIIDELTTEQQQAFDAALTYAYKTGEDIFPDGFAYFATRPRAVAPKTDEEDIPF